jgi:hypothetical protein
MLKDNLQKKGQMFEQVQYFFVVKKPFKKDDVQ